ncbi:uncharacterized protein LOC121048311 [Ixodes scapularis]|uniref:uncharacterized protein LOC121048311 n=1 Tax=Ixodes scapularis TaxID=6945 RepID=UPI001C38F9AD|nr:uncharacterized protein LOC121048311 [Ixodes scapularis]
MHFPLGKKDEVRLQAWVKLTDRKDFQPTPSSRVCKDHFEGSELEGKRVDGRRLLRWNAVPTIPPSDGTQKKARAKVRKKSTNDHLHATSLDALTESQRRASPEVTPGQDSAVESSTAVLNIQAAPEESSAPQRLDGHSSHDRLDRLGVEEATWCRSGHVCMLVLDSFRCHISDRVKNTLVACHTNLVIIPGGMTSQLQQLDVCLNKPMKDYVGTAYNERLNDGEHALTPAGSLKRATLDDLEHTKAMCKNKAWDYNEKKAVDRAVALETAIKSTSDVHGSGGNSDQVESASVHKLKGDKEDTKKRGVACYRCGSREEAARKEEVAENFNGD